MLAFGIKKHGGGRNFTQPEFTRIGADQIIGTALWLGDELEERFEVLTIQDGKIVDMQGCRSRQEAKRFAPRP